MLSSTFATAPFAYEADCVCGSPDSLGTCFYVYDRAQAESRRGTRIRLVFYITSKRLPTSKVRYNNESLLAPAVDNSYGSTYIKLAASNKLG